MRKIITLLFIFIAIPIYSQWLRQDSGVTANLNDVYCISPDVVIAVGEAGSILKTTDGGVHWIQKNSGTAGLSKVQFVDTNVGYAVGSAGTLLKTLDAGENWNSIDTGSTENLYGLSCLNENVFFISGDNGLLKKTTNGGGSFESLNTSTTETIKDIQFFCELSGYAEIGETWQSGQGDSLFKTIDGGTTWLFLRDSMNAFFFVNENVGFLNTVREGLHKTTDGGLSLTYLEGHVSTEADLFALSENKIWKAEYTLTLCECDIYCITKGEISNSGEFANLSNCNMGSINEVYLQSIFFANETTGFAVGWGGAILKNATGNMLKSDDFETKNQLSIYPNPVTDILNVNLPENAAVKALQVYDLTGKKIAAAQMGDHQIDASGLANGLYVLEITTGQENTAVKFVKE